MGDKTIILSISMLISGKDDMQKSLESLHYFKDAFPCEVILVDTGCSAEQRALAERYADKVLDFAWCNDFAAARNVGLKAAKGEWFLYLDDDEWFENPSEMVAFFKTGEYRNYNCASYVVRNYSDRQGIMYDDSYPSRMVKLEPETRFVGKIHEYLVPFRLPKKTFSDFVHHYGYAYKNEEEKQRHARRNTGPLLEMRKEHPGDPRWICQLAQEYFSVDQYEEVIDACKKGLDEWNTLKECIAYAPSHVGAVYAYILISMEMLKNYKEEEKWLKRALEEPVMKMEVMVPTIAFYCLAGARLYSNTKKYELCHQYFKRYLDFWTKWKDNRSIVEAGAAAIVAVVFQEQSLYGVILMSMESIIRMEDYALAEEAFYLMNWDDRRLLHQNKWEKGIVEACCSVPHHPLWRKILQTLVSREDGMKEMQVVFLETEVMYRQQGDLEKLLKLRRLVAEMNFEHLYIWNMKILWTDKNPDMESREQRRQEIINLFEILGQKYAAELFEVRDEVWGVAERYHISLEPVILQMKYREWKNMVETWSLHAEPGKLQQWDKRIGDWKTQADMRYDLFAVKCIEGYLRRYEIACPTLQTFEEMLERYADAVLKLYRPYYKEFVFEEFPDILPEEAQLALLLKEVQKCRRQGDDRSAVSRLRQCLGLYPVLEAAIGEYARQYADEVKRKNEEAESAKSELEQIVESLKMTAKLRMERKEYLAAKEILLQVRQCVPEDEEVRELLARLELESVDI